MHTKLTRVKRLRKQILLYVHRPKDVKIISEVLQKQYHNNALQTYKLYVLCGHTVWTVFGAHGMSTFEGRKPGNNLDYKKCLPLIDKLHFRAELGGRNTIKSSKIWTIILINCVVQK